MSFVGSLLIRIDAEDNKIVKAEVVAEKEVDVCGLIAGKTVPDALSVVGSIFALCPNSQKAAAEVAMSAARHRPANEEKTAELARSVQSERISEAFRFFVLQLSDPEYRSLNKERIVEIWKLVRQLNSLSASEGEWNEMRESIRGKLRPLLLEGFSEHWEDDLLNGTMPPEATGIRRPFARLSKRRIAGWTTLPILKIRNEILLDDLREAKQTPSGLVANGARFVTGSVSRMRGNPLVHMLLRKDGDCAYTRLVARFAELLSDLDAQAKPADLISVLPTAPNKAVSLVQNSRGVLLHYAHLVGSAASPIVHAYEILTPTEINVTKSSSFVPSLIGLEEPTEEKLREIAELVVLSYDPCTEIKVEVNRHA